MQSDEFSEAVRARVGVLHQQGLSIVESIKAISLEFRLPLGEAKKAVARHEVWSAVVKASEPLHDELNNIN
jgi:hypothetical protein